MQIDKMRERKKMENFGFFTAKYTQNRKKRVSLFGEIIKMKIEKGKTRKKSRKVGKIHFRPNAMHNLVAVTCIHRKSKRQHERKRQR